MKPISWNALMALEEDEIKERFPNGVVSAGHDKRDDWLPADLSMSGIGRRTLKELLRERKLAKSSADRTTYLKATAPPDYTDRIDKAVRDGGVVPPNDFVDAETEEAHRRHEITHAGELRKATMRNRITRLRQLAMQRENANKDTSELDALIERWEQAA